MNHKEKLDYWKEHDPIHYYEMTSDPTGVGNNPSSFPFFMLICGIIGFGYFIYKAFLQ